MKLKGKVPRDLKGTKSCYEPQAKKNKNE